MNIRDRDRPWRWPGPLWNSSNMSRYPSPGADAHGRGPNLLVPLIAVSRNNPPSGHVQTITDRALRILAETVDRVPARRFQGPLVAKDLAFRRRSLLTHNRRSSFDRPDAHHKRPRGILAWGLARRGS